jgi:hypothetical protein
MKRILFFIALFFINNLIIARCNQGFITIKAKIITINGMPIKDVIGFGFINNSPEVYYHKLWLKIHPDEAILELNKGNEFSLSKADGDIEIKLYFNTWSKPEKIMEPYCEERIRRIDVIFFKEDYLPQRKTIFPIIEDIKVDYNKPLNNLIINIGNIKMKKIKTDKEKEDFIIK